VNDLISATESALVMNDLSKLTTEQRLSYYKNVCESVGLNHLTQPFEFLNLNGKIRLYAKKDATEQLRKIHGVSLEIISRETVNDVYVVTARATDKHGRKDESIGAVATSGLKGDALANAIMKADTKAKRRVTLSICGLGMLDETELETIPREVIKQISEPKSIQQKDEAKALARETLQDSQKRKYLCDLLDMSKKMSAKAKDWAMSAPIEAVDEQTYRLQKELGIEF